MALNLEPLRNITSSDVKTYEDNGVVCLRKVFDPEWIETLIPSAYEISVNKKDLGLLPSAPGRYMSRIIPEFRKFIFNSPLAQAAAETMKSSKAVFFFDEIFAKSPESESKTIWHCDRMGWPVKGHMVPSIWIPLGHITKENSLEVISGSHRQDIKYWLFSPNARKMVKPEERIPHPDESKLRSDPNNQFLNWDMEPGDMLVLHPWVLHYSSGNTDKKWRIAISVRIFGDDIVWDPRPDCVNLAGVSFDEMVPGNPPKGPLFPVLWSKDGYKEDDKLFPRSFATTWNAPRRDTVNQDDLFNKLANEQR